MKSTKPITWLLKQALAFCVCPPVPKLMKEVNYKGSNMANQLYHIIKLGALNSLGFCLFSVKNVTVDFIIYK